MFSRFVLTITLKYNYAKSLQQNPTDLISANTILLSRDHLPDSRKYNQND